VPINSTFYPSGFGELTGDSLVIAGPWYTSGSAYYVSSVSGDDSNAGTERLQPKKTLASAVAAAGSGDIVILAADFDETLTSSQSVGDGITIVGAGSDRGSPTAKISINSDSSNAIALTGVDTSLINILFPTSVQNNCSSRVRLGAGGGVASARNTIRGCRFESTSTDLAAGLLLESSSDVTVEGCEFVVTGTTGEPPHPGLQSSDDHVDGLVIRDTTFDGGTLGYAGGVGLDLRDSEVTFIRLERLSLINGADVDVRASSTGRINAIDVTGSGLVTFSDVTMLVVSGGMLVGDCNSTVTVEALGSV